MVSSGSWLCLMVPAIAGWQQEVEAAGEASPALVQALGELGWNQLAPWSGRGLVALRPHRQGLVKQTWLGERPGVEGGVEEGLEKVGVFHKEWSWWVSHPSGSGELKLDGGGGGGGGGAGGHEAVEEGRVPSMEEAHWLCHLLPLQAVGTSSLHI